MWATEQRFTVVAADTALVVETSAAKEVGEAFPSHLALALEVATPDRIRVYGECLQEPARILT